jgi:sugar O-acyltransferase (sialic acid O-acetyltransferase NeuD family)
MTKKILIFGTGGNCIDILDTINEINYSKQQQIYKCIGFLDDDPQKWHKEFYGTKVLGPLASASEYKDCFFVNGIGSTSNFWKKEEIIAQAGICLERFETIIHPTAAVSKMATLGYGTVVFQNVTITSNVTIGHHVMILPNAVISHDDIVGAYTCIAGGVCVSGNVKIGHSCYLGTNCALMSEIKLGDYCLIGMGSVVLTDVPDNSVMVGNPARFLRKTGEITVEEN